jgi:hypothetical protein
LSDLGVVLGYNEDPSNFNILAPTLCANGHVLTLPSVAPESVNNYGASMNVLGVVVGQWNFFRDTSPDSPDFLGTRAALWRPSLTRD